MSGITTLLLSSSIELILEIVERDPSRVGKFRVSQAAHESLSQAHPRLLRSTIHSRTRVPRQDRSAGGGGACSVIIILFSFLSFALSLLDRNNATASSSGSRGAPVLLLSTSARFFSSLPAFQPRANAAQRTVYRIEKSGPRPLLVMLLVRLILLMMAHQLTLDILQILLNAHHRVVVVVAVAFVGVGLGVLAAVEVSWFSLDMGCFCCTNSLYYVHTSTIATLSIHSLGSILFCSSFERLPSPFPAPDVDRVDAIMCGASHMHALLFFHLRTSSVRFRALACVRGASARTTKMRGSPGCDALRLPRLHYWLGDTSVLFLLAFKASMFGNGV